MCAATIRRSLRGLGIVPTTVPIAAPQKVAPDKSAKRYGYTAAHRRDERQRYSTDLTDPEWALVSDLFGRSQSAPRSMLLDQLVRGP